MPDLNGYVVVGWGMLVYVRTAPLASAVPKLEGALVYVNSRCSLTEARRKRGGEGGIRTHGTIAGTPVFETGPIDHSGTSPQRATLESRARNLTDAQANRNVRTPHPLSISGQTRFNALG